MRAATYTVLSAGEGVIQASEGKGGRGKREAEARLEDDVHAVLEGKMPMHFCPCTTNPNCFRSKLLQ